MGILKSNNLNYSMVLFCTVLLNALNGCRNKLPKNPSAIEIIDNSFSVNQIETLEKEFNEYLDEMLFYRQYYFRPLIRQKWKVLEPLYIKSDYSRMVAFIPCWSFINDAASNSMIWVNGFFHNNKWYFFRRNDTQLMHYKEDARPDFDPLNWKPTLSEIESYTKGYIKYDIERKDWVINDDWFQGYFYETDSDLKSEYMNKDISEIPEEYWVHRYKLNTKIQEYKLQKTKQYWEKEDELYKQNKISEREWQLIQGRRNPKTDEDMRNLDKFYREVLKDVTDTTYVNLLEEANPGFKERLAKRNKKYGRQNDE